MLCLDAIILLGMYKQHHFPLQHAFRIQNVLNIHGSAVPSSHSCSSPRLGIKTQYPVQVPQLLVNTLFPSFYFMSTLVNNSHKGGYMVVETCSTCVRLELPFCLRWCKRCTEQWKINCLSVSSWHTLSHHSPSSHSTKELGTPLPLPQALRKNLDLPLGCQLSIWRTRRTHEPAFSLCSVGISIKQLWGGEEPEDQKFIRHLLSQRQSMSQHSISSNFQACLGLLSLKRSWTLFVFMVPEHDFHQVFKDHQQPIHCFVIKVFIGLFFLVCPLKFYSGTPVPELM